MQILCSRGREICNKVLLCPIVAPSTYSSLQNPLRRGLALSLQLSACWFCPLARIAELASSHGSLSLPSLCPPAPPSRDTSCVCALAIEAFCPWRASCCNDTAGWRAGSAPSQGRMRRGGGAFFCKFRAELFVYHN